MEQLLARLDDLFHRHERFTFDLRGNCRVLDGIVVEYAHAALERFAHDPVAAIQMALQQDGILGVSHDPATGAAVYTSCRLFTAPDQAMRFARTEARRSFFNLNRGQEIAVSPVPIVYGHASQVEFARTGVR